MSSASYINDVITRIRIVKEGRGEVEGEVKVEKTR